MLTSKDLQHEKRGKKKKRKKKKKYISRKQPGDTKQKDN